MLYHIVIAEDEGDVREFLVRAFQRCAPKATILAATDGTEALELIHRYGCDLLITDQRMPKMTGIELVEALHRENKSFPTIVISADTTIEPAARAAGISAFYLKPLTFQQIRNMIQLWFPQAGPA